MHAIQEPEDTLSVDKRGYQTVHHQIIAFVALEINHRKNKTTYTI